MSKKAPRTRWARLTGGVSGSDYTARLEAMAAAGQDVHGEASFCAALVPPPARVLDAGCGTGRVAIRLHDLGFQCVGVDVDESMLAVAMAAVAASSRPDWVLADLSPSIWSSTAYRAGLTSASLRATSSLCWPKALLRERLGRWRGPCVPAGCS